MASALPIILAAGAAAVLLGKKRKKSSEPDFSPGSGMDEEEEDAAIDLILMGKQVTPQQQMVLTSIPAKTIAPPSETDPDRVKKEEEDVKPSGACKVGTVSADKKYVCWGSPGAVDKNLKIQMRRVVTYKEARNSAAAVAIGTLGGGGAVLTQSPRIQFAIYCWINRKKLYRCTSRYKTGKKRCKPGKWARY